MAARDLVLCFLVPAIVAGASLWALARARPRREAPLASALAFGAAYWIAHVSLVGAPRAPWGEAEPTGRDWIAWFVVLAILVSALREVGAWKRFSRELSVAILCVAMPRAWLAPALETAHPGATGLLLRFAISAGLYALWIAAERLAEKRPGPAIPAAYAVATAGVAVTTLFARSASMALLSGAVCVALVAAAVVAALVRDARLHGGAIAVTLVVCFGAVCNVATYELPLASALALGVAFVAPWLAEIGPLADLGGPRAFTLRVIATALPALAAAGIARASAPGSYGY